MISFEENCFSRRERHTQTRMDSKWNAGINLVDLVERIERAKNMRFEQI